MITEDYVSFETAKLLKEKGFTGECSRFYMPSGHGRWKYEHYHDFDISDRIECPTLQMAMKWLREEKHYYIQVMLDGWACGGHSGYYVVIQKTDSDFEMMLFDVLDEVFYKTPEEACEEAIKYCLENLI